MMWEGIDRRQFPRVNYRCRVRVSNRGKKQEVFETHTENIGAGGICVILDREFDLFRNADLELFLPENRTIKCGGTIVWVIKRRGKSKKEFLGYDVGIEFTDIEKEDRSFIADLVQKLLGE